MIESKEELIALAYQVLDDEFGINAEDYSNDELKCIKSMIEVILTRDCPEEDFIKEQEGLAQNNN